MSEFPTGATPEQLSDAIQRHCTYLWSLADAPPPDDDRIRAWLDRSNRDNGTVDYWAARLVPPGFRIVPDGDTRSKTERTHVLVDRDRWEREQARLARVVAWANARLSLDGFEPRDTPAVLMFKHEAAWEALESGDLESIRPNAAESDSSQKDELV